MSDWGDLQIAEYRFRVTEALLRANLIPGPRFYWTLRVYSTGPLDDERINPCLYSENLLGLLNVKIARWTDIIGKKLRWDACYNERFDSAEASMDVYSSEDISNATLEFLEAPSGLAIRWQGVTEVSSEKFDNYTEIQFNLDTGVVFEGFATIDISEDKAVDQLRQFVTEEPLMNPKSIGDGILLFEPSSKKEGRGQL